MCLIVSFFYVILYRLYSTIIMQLQIMYVCKLVHCLLENAMFTKMHYQISSSM